MDAPANPVRTPTLKEHNLRQMVFINDPEIGALSPKNLWYAGQYYKHEPSRREAMMYWILEAKCGEKYRIEHPGPEDTTTPEASVPSAQSA